MKKKAKNLLLFLLGWICWHGVFAQEMRSFTSFNPAKNSAITRFDGFDVDHCHTLDNTTSIGIVHRPLWIDMFLGVFKNSRKDTVTAVFDSLNRTDYPVFLHFYKTNQPADGIIILWEARYIYDAEWRAYWYKNGVVRRLGSFEIDYLCAKCRNVYYPVKAIHISTNGDRVMFKFTKDLVFRVSQRVEANKFLYIYEKREWRPVILD